MPSGIRDSTLKLRLGVAPKNYRGASSSVVELGSIGKSVILEMETHARHSGRSGLLTVVVIAVAVRGLNSCSKGWAGSIYARWAGVQAKPYFETTEAARTAPPQVHFSPRPSAPQPNP